MLQPNNRDTYSVNGAINPLTKTSALMAINGSLTMQLLAPLIDLQYKAIQFIDSGGVARTVTLDGSNVRGQIIKVIQDITYIANKNPGTLLSVAYVAGGVAGSEVVTVSGTAISVKIASGVSTANQVLAAINASQVASSLINGFISGTGSTAQVAVGATTLPAKSATFLSVGDFILFVSLGGQWVQVAASTAIAWS